MATWALFHSRLLPHVMGCTIPLADQALRDSAAELLARSRVWRAWLEPALMVQGVREYDLDPPKGASVSRIEQATMGGRPLSVDSSFLLANPALQSSVGNGLSTENLSTVVLTFDPVPGQQLAIQASLMPSLTATGVPDHLAIKYMAGIVAGARARIRLLPGFEFSNPSLAAVDQDEAEKTIATAVHDAWTAFSSARPRSQPTWC